MHGREREREREGRGKGRSVTLVEINQILALSDTGRRYHVAVQLVRDMQNLDRPII